MSKPEKNVVAAPSRSRKIKWVIIIFFVALAAVGVMNLPRGYSDDLSRIGKGKVAVVLVRDKNAVQTYDLMEVMNDIRDEQADRVDFLLTDFDTPQGKAFMAANGAGRATLVLLDRNGKRVNVLYSPQTTVSLKEEIAAALKSTP